MAGSLEGQAGGLADSGEELSNEWEVSMMKNSSRKSDRNLRLRAAAEAVSTVRCLWLACRTSWFRWRRTTTAPKKCESLKGDTSRLLKSLGAEDFSETHSQAKSLMIE